jgi:WD40 repeat protein
MKQNLEINIELKSGKQSVTIVNSIKFNTICELPGNNFIATSKNFIYEINLDTQKTHKWTDALRGGDSIISCCCLLGNQKHLITGSEDGKIRAWDIKKGDVLYILDDGLTYPIISVVPNNIKKHQLISSSYARIKIWDVPSRQRQKLLLIDNPSPIICIINNNIITQVNNNIKSRIINSKDVILWNEQNGMQLFINENKIITSLNTLDESHIICGYEEGLIKIWNIETRIERILGSHISPVCDLSLLNDGRLASIDTSGIIQIWNLEIYDSEYELKYYQEPILANTKIKVLNNGNIIAHYGKTMIKLWDLQEFPQLLPTFNDHGESLDKEGNVLPNCPICWDVINDNMSRLNQKLPCGEIFHKKCMEKKTHCPICDKVIV